jgi:ubiquinone biosynthesis protein Coq4
MYQQLKKWRSSFLVYLTHRMALPLLKLIRKPEIFPYTAAQLAHFPSGTLGNDLALFLDKKELTLLPYYARHDLKHILLEYDTTDEGEGSLQCFMLGNRHVSFPVIATVFYCFATMPEHWKKFMTAFKKGRQAQPIADWKWFDILTETTNSLKQQIHARS